ncbi:hypothetical protein MF410_32145 (plasmid) [Rhizobium sp. C104]|uniref:hypothetical protein n=1 Tax=Rhizobium sp. C104 TaxID=2917727 RepID=UPI001EF87498|nr:hypothetical protein [Rhizobium sp. C104]ULJ82504.1 hypothetical protein MF410_32145 [Rhizobium sp. C104]
MRAGRLGRRDESPAVVIDFDRGLAFGANGDTPACAQAKLRDRLVEMDLVEIETVAATAVKADEKANTVECRIVDVFRGRIDQNLAVDRAFGTRQGAGDAPEKSTNNRLNLASLLSDRVARIL